MPASRVSARAGDLRRDALGEGYDLVLLSTVCHTGALFSLNMLVGTSSGASYFGRRIPHLARAT